MTRPLPPSHSPETVDSTRWRGVPSTDEMANVLRLIEGLANVPPMKYIADSFAKRDDSRAEEELLLRMRLSTQAVRNWDYHEETISTARILYGPLAGLLKEQLGFHIDDLLKLATTMSSLVKVRTNDYATMLRNVMRTQTDEDRLARYYDWKPQLKGSPEVLLEALKSLPVDARVSTFVVSHSSFCFLPEMYTFDIPTLSMESDVPEPAIEAIFRAIALKPGALVGANPKHLFLQNPGLRFLGTAANGDCSMTTLFGAPW